MTVYACSIDGCPGAPYARGYCEKHYRRVLRHGDPETVLRAPEPVPCSVTGCAHVAEARGWCHGHYQRFLRKGDVMKDEPLSRRKFPAECTVAGCGRASHGRGLCKTHYNRLQRYGDVLADKPIRVVTGKGSISHGYRKVPVPRHLRHLTNGETPVGEHRLVMARHLGRALYPDETVHHRNGVRTDNRIENLELWTTAHPKGQRIEEKVAFALEMLRRYRPELLAE